MKMTKEKIESLVETVVVPFERRILDDKGLGKYLVDEETRIKYDIGVAKLAVLLLTDEEKAAEYFRRGAQAHNDLAIKREEMQYFLSIFFRLHREWFLKHFQMTKEEYDRRIERFERLFMEAYRPKEANDTQDDGFFTFESEEVDEAIDRMHHEEKRKISAREYASYDEITDDEMHTIREAKERCEHLTGLYERLDEKFMEEFAQMAKELSGALFATMEFKDMGYALGIFSEELQGIDVDSLDEQKSELLFALFLQMSDDLIHWIDAVFIDEEAVDIHYFDASFLSNIAQVGLLQEENNFEEGESGDDFLF